MKSKMNLNLAVMALVILSATAHLEINIVAGPSAKISAKDETLPGKDKSSILCRTAIGKGTQQGRDPNDPTLGAVCHNLPMLTGDRLATLKAGGEFTWGILADKLGSGHDGGHCAWWVSDGTDQTKWYKFMDDLDCTNNAKSGNQPGKIKIPKNLPVACKSACTLMWLWSPLHTANCEIYSNCFDVKIEGVTGGIQDDYPMKRTPFKCIRVNPESHKTSSFGKYINVAKDGAITLEKVTDGDQTCTQYVVRDGDKLAAVLAKFDFEDSDLYKLNGHVMSDKDTLPAVGEKLVIVGCEKEPEVASYRALNPVNSAGSMYLSMLAVLGGTLASLF